jgi:hypothetical protein
MSAIASHRFGRLVALLMLALTACAGQLLAAVCDHPVVHFQAGQLTLSSNGCSLQQVLTAVGRNTGIETKLPASTSTVPVFANLGPGDPRQVVSALLDGIPFNWSLALAEGGSRSLVGVVLTEQIRSPEAATPSVAAVTTEHGNLLAGQTLPGNKRGTTLNAGKGKEAATEASLEDQPDQRKRRAEIDDSTLSKLPPLPPGVPTGMWQLYPDVVANIVANDGAAQSSSPALPNGQLASSLTPSASGPGSVGRGCRNCPVPPGVDPRIVNLYPWNLMQLIQSPITQPPLQLPPPAQFPRSNP